MARQKSDIIKDLKDAGATQAESTLNKKSAEKLEEMLKELKEGQEQNEESTEEEVTDAEVQDETQDEPQEEKTQEEEVNEETTESEELTDEDIQDGLEATEKELGSSEFENVGEYKHQLRISTEFLYHVKVKGAHVMVKNEGGGDVYVSDERVKVGDIKHRLTFGETTLLKDPKVVHLIAASQPEVTITELK